MPSRAIPYLKVVAHLLLLVPFMGLVWTYKSGYLAAQSDPVNFLTHATGDWGLWTLLASLTISPIRRLVPKLGCLIRFRRLVGLYAFFYVTLHLLIYVLLFSGYDTQTAISGAQAGHFAEVWRQFVLVWPSILDDLKNRPFIQVGLLAWLLLLSLAITSPQRVLRWMGGKKWQALHRMVYVAAVAAVVHYMWLVKKGVHTPWKDGGILIVLLLLRIWFAIQKRRKRAAPPSSQTAQAAF